MELRNQLDSNSNSNQPTAEIPILPSPTLDPNPNPNPNREMIRYRECQRNHAAHLGGHVVDGCGEFMPGGDEGTPLSLKCAACDCHRNFHRRERDGDPSSSAAAASPRAPPLLPLPPPAAATTAAANCYISFNTPANNGKPQKSPVVRPPPQYLQQQQHHPSHHVTTAGGQQQSRAPVMMAFGGGGAGAAESSSEDLHVAAGAGFAGQYGTASSKKRFRTKFSQEQKERMTEFAERIGWKIQKQDENDVVRFCDEVGVKRQVFKVWLHNNKQAMKRKQG